MNGELATLLDIVDGADAAPTPQAVAAVADLEKSLQALMARWSELKTRGAGVLNNLH